MPSDQIITEDGQPVGVGDRVFCYYDGWWGTIKSVEDTGQVASAVAPYANQALWAIVVGDDDRQGYFNGQRLATKERP